MIERDLSPVYGNIDLFVDHRVVETGIAGLKLGTSVDHPTRAGPIDSAETHGTGFAGSIEIAAGKLPVAEAGAGVADGHYFGMRGRIIGRRHLVMPLSND